MPAPAAAFTMADIERFALFAGLPPDILVPMPPRIRSLEFERGETIIEYGASGAAVFLVLKGQLLAKRFSAGGQESGYRRIVELEYFGELASLDGGSRSVSIVALEKSHLGVIAAADFDATLAQWPPLTHRLLADMAKRIRDLSDRLFEANTVSLQGRVASELARMALAADVTSDGGILPDMPTHAEMAARVGGQRETVTRAFNRLVDAGIVARQGRRLVIHDFGALLAQTGE